MLTATPPQTQIKEARFLRKTTLRWDESNSNFKMLDNDIGEAITSEGADKITPLMSKVYTRLLLTPTGLREGERTLRFTGEENEDGSWTTAWVQLCRHLRVSSETARKAIGWMHEQGIIGYYAGKNGVGIRIFLNRAAASVSVRQSPPRQKNLPPAHGSTQRAHASAGDTPFKDSYAVRETLEKDINPPAPKIDATDPISIIPSPPNSRSFAFGGGGDSVQNVEKEIARPPAAQTIATPPRAQPTLSSAVLVDEIVAQLRNELEQSMNRKATQAAILAAQNEVAQTRRWFEERALPKAVRIAQKESFDVLRKYGLISKSGPSSDVGRRSAITVSSGVSADGSSGSPPQVKTAAEIRELAESCVALFELQGKPLEETLAELSSRAGAWLSAADLGCVGVTARQLLQNTNKKGTGKIGQDEKLCDHQS